MTVDALIILSGALVALMPFLGFPTSWDTAIFFILGVFVVGLGIAVRRKKVQKGFARPEQHGLHKQELFTESRPQPHSDVAPHRDPSVQPRHEEQAN